MDSERPIILGHRGLKGPLENTLPAFKRALRHCDGIEFDVRVTADGKLVAIHDGEFQVGGIKYIVKSLTYRELTRLHPRGRLIPTVGKILKLRPGLINADLKDLDALIPLIDSLERKKMLERTVISTDVWEWIPIIHRACPDCRIGFSITNAMGLVRSLHAKVYSLHVPLDLVEYLGLEGFVALLNLYRKNREVWLWNYMMNEIEIVPRVIGLANAVISDDPLRLKRFIFSRLTWTEAT